MNDHWAGAVEAVVEVGDAVALLRQTLAAEIARDRLAAQGRADMYAHGRLNELLAAMDPPPSVVLVLESTDCATGAVTRGKLSLVDLQRWRAASG
jgi:hypothetical protein